MKRRMTLGLGPDRPGLVHHRLRLSPSQEGRAAGRHHQRPPALGARPAVDGPGGGQFARLPGADGHARPGSPAPPRDHPGQLHQADPDRLDQPRRAELRDRHREPQRPVRPGHQAGRLRLQPGDPRLPPPQDQRRQRPGPRADRQELLLGEVHRPRRPAHRRLHALPGRGQPGRRRGGRPDPGPADLRLGRPQRRPDPRRVAQRPGVPPGRVPAGRRDLPRHGRRGAPLVGAGLGLHGALPPDRGRRRPAHLHPPRLDHGQPQGGGQSAGRLLGLRGDRRPHALPVRPADRHRDPRPRRHRRGHPGAGDRRTPRSSAGSTCPAWPATAPRGPTWPAAPPRSACWSTPAPATWPRG